jgi:hypothetical protein
VRAVIYSGGGGRWERRPAAMGPGKKEEGDALFLLFCGWVCQRRGLCQFCLIDRVRCTVRGFGLQKKESL